jgi:uncharacterized protein (DUF2252 family)
MIGGVIRRPPTPRRPSPDQLYEQGKRLRDKCARKSHADWKPGPHRRSALQVQQQANRGRIAHLVPIRNGRMLKSPFTFFRGAALNMAIDLAHTPTTGLDVQACGDAHLLNFGAFATPERHVIFDINDLDETLPAPWEWDVKRLAASMVLACRSNGFSDGKARDCARECVTSYRERMLEYSQMRALDVWYARIDLEDLIQDLEDPDAKRRIEKRLAEARQHSVVEHDFPRLAAMRGERPMIKDNPPLVYHAQTSAERDELMVNAHSAFIAYRESLSEDRRVLLDRYELADLAMKVVGVGSVGTLCGVVLLMACKTDPLFLQVKEARASVLEAAAGKSVYPNHGQRVVCGYRLMQAASDIFLGWTEGQEGRHFYVRQLRDMKISPYVELFGIELMARYGRICGHALARAHARSGQPALIAGYLGKSEPFDDAVAKFALAYADQTEQDHDALRKASRDGRLEVVVEPD